MKVLRIFIVVTVKLKRMVLTRSVNGAGAGCDQKTSKFFASHWEESMAGHVGVNGTY
jgi:hypothetical protein